MFKVIGNLPLFECGHQSLNGTRIDQILEKRYKRQFIQGLSMSRSRILNSIAAAAIFMVSIAAHAEMALVGTTIAAGRLKTSVAAEVQDEARRKNSCASVDSITIAPLSGKTGNQFNSQGELRIGSVQERWTASLCGGVAAFIIEFTGNGMMGVTFTVRAE